MSTVHVLHAFSIQSSRSRYGYKIEIALLSNHVPLRILHSTNVYDISNLIKMLIEVIQQKK
jgi:hypothetical protein